MHLLQADLSRYREDRLLEEFRALTFLCTNVFDQRSLTVYRLILTTCMLRLARHMGRPEQDVLSIQDTQRLLFEQSLQAFLQRATHTPLNEQPLETVYSGFLHGVWLFATRHERVSGETLCNVHRVICTCVQRIDALIDQKKQSKHTLDPLYRESYLQVHQPFWQKALKKYKKDKQLLYIEAH